MLHQASQRGPSGQQCTRNGKHLASVGTHLASYQKT
uniref:Uncharacterized protein n=1 Tax=Arundo donax TaxID=35708 RepID=A0A0A8ZH13_ARUDO